MNNMLYCAGHATAAGDYGPGTLDVSEIFLPVVAHDGTGESVQLQDILKRGMDVVGALSGLVVLAPLGTLIALAVKLTSKGPVFFTQERAGLNGRPFRMIKFRSMVIDAEAQLKHLVNVEDLAEPVYKIKDDPRVTRVGRFLRRFGLDELPQLLNILRGEMSLVGPRPEVVALTNRYNREQQRRLQVKPGLTGYQQIHNRGMPDMAARLAFDLHYLHHRNTSMDIWIIAMTVFVIASGREITY